MSTYTTSDWNGYDIQCNGGDNGEITMGVTGGVDFLPYTYDIDGVSNGSNIFSSLSEGTYVITATDENDCQTTQTVEMIAPDSSVVLIYTQSDYNGVGVSCYGDTNGFINTSVAGGVLDYSFLWSTGDTTSNIDNIGLGDYTVTVTDANGCIDSETITVTEPLEYVSSYVTNVYNSFGVSCNGSTDGSIDVTVVGGTSPHSYLWSTGATTEDLDSIGAGTYVITATDTNGCPTTQTVTITEPDSLLSGSLSIDQTICYNTVPDTIESITLPVGGNQPYSFNWQVNMGSGFTTLNDSLDWYAPSFLDATTTYVITYSDDYECGVFTDTVTITVLEQVNPGTIVSNQTLCYDSIADDLSFSDLPTGGNGLFNYEWQDSVSGGTWSAIGQSNPNLPLSNMTESTYFRVKVKSDLNSNCIDRYTDSIYIEVYDTLSIGVISDQTICYNTTPDTLIFSNDPTGAGGNYSYIWYSSTDINTLIVDSNQTDSFLPLSSLTETTFYKVKVISDFGCGEKNSDIIEVMVYDEFNPGIISDNDTVCFGEDPQAILSSTSASGGDGIYYYKWEHRTNNSTWDSIPGATSNSYQPTSLTDSTDYRLIVENAGCSIIDTTNIVNIIVNPLPVPYSIIGDLTVCANQSNASYTLDATPTNYRYMWFTNVGNIIGTNESKNCLVDWPYVPNTIADLEVEVRIYETGCKITTETFVDISSNFAPSTTDIQQMENTNILVCNDSSLNISYQWGYTNILSGDDVIIESDTLRYNQFTNTIDTTINRYWVITYFNYGNNESCSTISYYNPPPDPLTISEKDNSVLFYPNPVFNILSWEGNNIDHLKIFDIHGREIQLEIEYSNKSIDFSSVRPGVYFIKYFVNGHNNLSKIIVK